jgi:hypothetical protein
VLQGRRKTGMASMDRAPEAIQIPGQTRTSSIDHRDSARSLNLPNGAERKLCRCGSLATEKNHMMKGGLLWLIGIPLPIILILWLLGYLS